MTERSLGLFEYAWHELASWHFQFALSEVEM